MTRPVRIRRGRAKGSRLTAPNDFPIVCVTRPGPWGNPFSSALAGAQPAQKGALRERAVRRFRHALLSGDAALPFTIEDVRHELRGKNLACWCPLDEPCHADVLLEVANTNRP